MDELDKLDPTVRKAVVNAAVFKLIVASWWALLLLLALRLWTISAPWKVWLVLVAPLLGLAILLTLVIRSVKVGTRPGP